MDVSALDPAAQGTQQELPEGQQQQQQQQQAEQPGGGQWDAQGQWWPAGPTGSEGDSAGVYALQKGKGKGKGSGCAICNAPDHWKNECPYNKGGKGGKGKGWQNKGYSKGKSKGKGGKGFYNKGKGWGKGAYNLEPDWSGSYDGDWSSNWGSVPALVLEKGVKAIPDEKQGEARTTLRTWKIRFPERWLPESGRFQSAL